MHDLLGAYQRLDRLYRLYLKSAFPLRSSVLTGERETLLAKTGVLSQDPLVETVPVYRSSGLNLAAAAEQIPPEYGDLADIGAALFRPGQTLYQHQWESLRAVVDQGQDVVVTTGTGSGKTESFLLPLFAQLARESSGWTRADPEPSDRRWWDEKTNDKGRRAPQWGHVTRPTALRAIVLYPLNALVEDQLRRLRIALDNDTVHKWLDRNRGGNRITFGRYVGLTPLAGPSTDRSRQARLRQELSNLELQRIQVIDGLRANRDADSDIAYYFPRLDGGEMWSRWDMQETPPDILITNYSMLNIMLMRSIEDSIFETTRAWLAEDDHPERQFFLIVDELHAYRGTPGTEVAYIIRLLLSRLGLTPDSPKLRILTTTASLDDDAKGRQFLREFFGRDRFSFIKGEQTPPKDFARLQMRQYRDAFEQFAGNVQSNADAGPPLVEDPAIKAAMGTLAGRLGQAVRPGQEIEQLGEALHVINAPDALRDACRAANGTVRPTRARDLDHELFPGLVPRDSSMPSGALRGLLLALGMSRRSSTARSAQPVRGHFFFHTLQNLWACCNPDCDDPDKHQESEVNMIARAAAPLAQRPTVGALHATHRIACSCGSRILDFIVCEVCGDVYLGGYKTEQKVGKTNILTLTADMPDLEAMPDRVSLTQRHGTYAVFWPLPHDKTAWATPPQDIDWTLDKIKRAWVKAKLNRTTGIVRIDKTDPMEGDIPGWLYQVVGKDGGGESAMPTKCARCDADYRYKKTFKSPLRNHRTGFQKATQVLATSLFREMLSDAPTTDAITSRKLVIFSDSRQDAAKLAAGMERDHFRDMVRVALIQSYRQYWDDLAAYLRVMFAGNSANLPMLQVLNPALYALVASPPQQNDAAARQRFVDANPSAVIMEAMAWVFGMPPGQQQAREQWLSLLQLYPGRLSLQRLRDAIRERLLLLGMCSGGPVYNALWYRSGDKKQGRLPWYTCYDWSQPGRVSSLVNPTQEQNNHITRMNALLMGEVMYALFPHIARTIEGLGQGWISYSPYEEPPQNLIHATEAVIRQLGTRRLHQYAEHVWQGDDDKLRSFAVRFASGEGIASVEVQQQLLRSEAGLPSTGGLVLAPDHLSLVLRLDDASTERAGYRCPECNAFYLHDVGNCPETEKPTRLVPSAAPSDFDYYTDLTQRGDAVRFRMHCEELTGQTDKDTRPKRQRWFQNVFIPGETPLIDGVDLLSVTTTMEAGVDIGALNAVMMANMPPRRFNYQQRVGRAGRRASGVSLAVTFCRGRSHDDFYFQRPESITGDPPPVPYVDMKSQPIFERVLIKEVLRQAFASVVDVLDADGGDNVHGAFGTAEEWSAYAMGIEAWLRSSANERTILSVMEALSTETVWAGSSGVSFRTDMLDYLRNKLVARMTEVADDRSYTQDALSERLANAGLLPMFGFPTRVRLLYTRWPRKAYPWPPDANIVDRDLDVAISQFAPGSQTVKDKAVYTAIGVADFAPRGNKVIAQEGFNPPLYEANSNMMIGLCDNCQATIMPFTPSVTLPANSLDLPMQQCPICHFSEPTLRVIDAREPKGFFTDLEPQDFEGQFDWQPRSTRPTLNVGAGASIANAATGTVGNVSVSTLTDHILSLNDNGGKGGFAFQNAKVFDGTEKGAYAVAPDPDDKSASVTVYGGAKRVALLSRRMTDILLVGINVWPTGVFADPTTVEGRAAWYSFAFWLRIAAGEMLDVDSQELQASFRSRSEGGRPIGEAFLCDSLENGAGYCNELAKPDRLEQLFRQSDATLSMSMAARWIETQPSPGEQTPHGAECDTSCNRCLRDFGNLPYHGLLDWRLALDMARLAWSDGTVIDLTSNWDSAPNPWDSLVRGSEAPIPTTLRRLGYDTPIRCGDLQGYVHSSRPKILIERHPLWRDDHPVWVKAEAAARSQYPNKSTICAVNPFRAIRRPVDYV